MAHLGTLRDFRFEDNADDIRGAALYGRDHEKLGKIDDVIFDHASGALKYVVVDTGGWLHSKKFLVPADRIQPHGEKDDEYLTELSKKQIENFPTYDESMLDDEKRWGDYEREYRGVAKFEETGDVLHQAGGTNILVPDGLPAEGPAPTTRTGQPVSGYKSPIRHHEAGMMDTTPLGVGHSADEGRLTFVPDAIGAGRGDIEDMPTVVPETAAADRGSRAAPVEQTMEGDAIFNSEDMRGRMHERGNIHDADEPSYATVSGSPTQTAEGRSSSYPDANQGQRWARFEENLRRQRPNIVGRCSACEEFQNRHKEDAA